MRLGVVLDPQGGALAQMLLPFKLGLGGPLGSGKQWVSWIGMDDLLYQIYQLFVDNSIEGPINIVSPNPVTNQQFSQILASCYNKPSVLRVPKLVLQTLKGEMAKEILLSSQKVHPKMLLDNNFKISYPDLNQYLDHTLGLV